MYIYMHVYLYVYMHVMHNTYEPIENTTIWYHNQDMDIDLSIQYTYEDENLYIVI